MPCYAKEFGVPEEKAKKALVAVVAVAVALAVAVAVVVVAVVVVLHGPSICRLTDVQKDQVGDELEEALDHPVTPRAAVATPSRM